MPQPIELSHDPQVTAAMESLVTPPGTYIACNDVLATLAETEGARLRELSSLPLAALGQRIVALRYFIANAEIWLRYFAWENPLATRDPKAPELVTSLFHRLRALVSDLPPEAVLRSSLDALPLTDLTAHFEKGASRSDDALGILVALDRYPGLRVRLRERLLRESTELHRAAPRTCDVIYLASYELTRLPATTVGNGALEYLIVADKGEMAVRAVRVALAQGMIPVVLFSRQDDANALQVRLAEAEGGFAIPLEGSFRESYANPTQIARQVLRTYVERFDDQATTKLRRSALYPGYGPLAENQAAIAHFRQAGIVFIGPPEDVVEAAGDKRRFRALAEAIDPLAVTPGVVIDTADEAEISAILRDAHARSVFSLPGRLKAANGGGGRGQTILLSADGIDAAVRKVCGEIEANGWDPGLIFEQNIARTIHLEVQVLRDRFGHTLHFGMRDCSEQRASQKIQEEAPPALLRSYPGLEARICEIAVRIADSVGYVGACTVELMFKEGKFYLLEMNTRIQVEHPVTEEAHRVRGVEKLDLVALQFLIATGAALPFKQEDVVQTHVAREFRINAESWKADLKDPRDGQVGLFLPNAGIFDVFELPKGPEVRAALENAGVRGIAELNVRVDSGFEVGDTLVNKDPTFAKLIVAVKPEVGFEGEAYELLRRASLEVLARARIEGRQVRPDGRVLPQARFETNLSDHIRVLESECLRVHSHGVWPDRHVGWVVEMLRGG